MSLYDLHNYRNTYLCISPLTWKWYLANKSLGYDCYILLFIDVNVKEGIEHVGDNVKSLAKEGDMKDVQILGVMLNYYWSTLRERISSDWDKTRYKHIKWMRRKEIFDDWEEESPCDRAKLIGQRLAWERKLLMIVETFGEGSGRDMVNIVIKFLIIVDVWTIIFIVWLILISISDWEWWE